MDIEKTESIKLRTIHLLFFFFRGGGITLDFVLLSCLEEVHVSQSAHELLAKFCKNLIWRSIINVMLRRKCMINVYQVLKKIAFGLRSESDWFSASTRLPACNFF